MTHEQPPADVTSRMARRHRTRPWAEQGPGTPESRIGRRRAARSASSEPVLFSAVGETEDGYDREQVRDWMAEVEAVLARLRHHPQTTPRLGSREVREKTFTAEQGGFCPEEVDAALAEAEDRLARAENQQLLSRIGATAHREQAQALAEVLLGRLARPAGQRFRAPQGRRTMGYLTKDVDAWCQEISRYFRETEHVQTAPARGIAFRMSSGSHAYDEAQVDAFIGRVLDLMHMLDSLEKTG